MRRLRSHLATALILRALAPASLVFMTFHLKRSRAAAEGRDVWPELGRR